MALIKCSECGCDISEKAMLCQKCGCPIDVTKQIISDNQKRKKKKITMIVIICLAIVAIAVVGIYLFLYSKKPDNIAIHIIKKDFGKSIEVESVYYNSEVNGCIVNFSVDGEDNTATVHLDDKTVGYKSVMDEYTEKSQKATDDEEKKRCAQQVVDYAEMYNILWEYNLFANGEKESGWEKIK